MSTQGQSAYFQGPKLPAHAGRGWSAESIGAPYAAASRSFPPPPPSSPHPALSWFVCNGHLLPESLRHMHQASGSLQSPKRNGKSLADTVTLATHGHHAWSPSRSGSLPPLAAVAVPPTNSSSASLPVASPRTPRPTAYVFGSHLPPTPTTVYNESTLTYRPVERPQSLSRGSSSSSLDVLKGAARQERRSSLSLSNLTIREMQDKESPQNGYEAERYGQ